MSDIRLFPRCAVALVVAVSLGCQGSPGLVGPTGPAGPQGERGPQGPAGQGWASSAEAVYTNGPAQVGIGTSTPRAALDVNGGLRVENDISLLPANDCGVRLRRSDHGPRRRARAAAREAPLREGRAQGGDELDLEQAPRPRAVPTADDLRRGGPERGTEPHRERADDSEPGRSLRGRRLPRAGAAPRHRRQLLLARGREPERELPRHPADHPQRPRGRALRQRRDLGGDRALAIRIVSSEDVVNVSERSFVNVQFGHTFIDKNTGAPRDINAVRAYQGWSFAGSLGIVHASHTTLGTGVTIESTRG